MPEALSSAVSCRFYSIMAGTDAVVHITVQHTLVHQYSSLAGYAFIIPPETTHIFSLRAVIHNRYLWSTDTLPHLAGKDTCSHTIEICLKSVTNGFVHQYSACTWRHHYRHFSTFRLHGIKEKGRAAYCRLGQIGKVRFRKLMKVLLQRQCGKTHLCLAVLLHHHSQENTSTGTVVRETASLRIDKQHLLVACGHGSFHLDDASIQVAHRLIQQQQTFFHQFNGHIVFQQGHCRHLRKSGGRQSLTTVSSSCGKP